MDLITKNGNKNVIINTATFKNAINLKKSAIKCLQDAEIIKDIGDLSNINIAAMLDKFVDILLNAEISDDFERALFECLQVCYIEDNGIKNKITRELFDEQPELREDYYEIVSKCVEVNLRPFFKSLITEFETRFKMKLEDLKPKLEQEKKD